MQDCRLALLFYAQHFLDHPLTDNPKHAKVVHVLRCLVSTDPPCDILHDPKKQSLFESMSENFLPILQHVQNSSQHVQLSLSYRHHLPYHYSCVPAVQRKHS
uniref:Uncharacterized protein n=1 Tax=Hanusia phi TaxID=3032 RepID=A0A7S0DXM9_9CRYP